MLISHIAGYQFVKLSALDSLKEALTSKTSLLNLKGTILLSEEGINMNLSGLPADINAFLLDLREDTQFADMPFHHTQTNLPPYRHLKIKIKKEIITLRQPDIDAATNRGPAISPETFKSWLDENRSITLLDTRNDYEIKFGTFKNAVNLHIHDFSHLPQAIHQLDKEKPLVMFCTGGIRCEKASLHLLNEGFKEVYQLDRGIIGYFANVGGEHYNGECFVFDERVAIDPSLKSNGTLQCKTCQQPIYPEEKHSH